MDNFLINKYKYFKDHNIKADVKNGDILAPKEVKIKDILGGNDKMIKKMSDIFHQSKPDKTDDLF